MREMWDFSPYSDSALKEIKWHLQKLESLRIYLGSKTMGRELSDELRKRGIKGEDVEIDVIAKLKSYEGSNSSLDVDVHDKEEKKDEMWIIMGTKDGEVKQSLTDYGYKTKEDAEEIAEDLADVVFS